jgi:fusion and transport protein UGO1
MWNLLAFLGSGLELAVRFPLETVLRRAQIATYTAPSIRQKYAATSRSSTSTAAEETSVVETIVPVPQTYRGIVGTMWGIVYEEGVSAPSSDAERALGKPISFKKRQGQGIGGLYRGWRIGMWGIAGIWGAGLLGSIGGGGDEEVMVSGGRF